MRYIETYIKEDLQDKNMIFLGGPRQVGKTTLALSFLKNGSEQHPAYLNWDDIRTHGPLLRGELPSNQGLLIFDEVHKFARWRNLIKGFYDTRKSVTRFIVTGSARLDYYRKGGDSLQGRYHYYRLHPFSLCELNSNPTSEDIKQLLQFSGFPEPLFKCGDRHWRRWQKERIERVLRDDLRDLEQVKEISLIELLIEELPSRVGSPLSIRNLKETLQVAHDTAERWISILERLYVCFRIAPFGSPKIRAVKKEQKLYFWDWTQVLEPGVRFENLVASHLLKYCHFLEDTEGYKMELRYFRDTDQREVDFIVMQDKQPLFAVECKSGEKAASSTLHYLRERTQIRRFYQVHLGTKDYGDAQTKVRVLPFQTFCKELALP